VSNNSISLSEHIPKNTKIKVFELCKDGKSLFKEFFEKIEADGNLLSDLARALRIIEDTANLKMCPKTKFRQLKLDKKIKDKVYEAKSGLVRIYLYHESNTGRIILMGGIKDNQIEDIKKVKNLILNYKNEHNS
jgi:hypothetical protein